jgi:hypothetical protein
MAGRYVGTQLSSSPKKDMNECMSSSKSSGRSLTRQRSVLHDNTKNGYFTSPKAPDIEIRLGLREIGKLPTPKKKAIL